MWLLDISKMTVLSISLRRCLKIYLLCRKSYFWSQTLPLHWSIEGLSRILLLERPTLWWNVNISSIATSSLSWSDQDLKAWIQVYLNVSGSKISFCLELIQTVKQLKKTIMSIERFDSVGVFTWNVFIEFFF